MMIEYGKTRSNSAHSGLITFYPLKTCGINLIRGPLSSRLLSFLIGDKGKFLCDTSHILLSFLDNGSQKCYFFLSNKLFMIIVVVVQSLSCVQLCATPLTAVPRLPVLHHLLEFAQFTFTELVMISNHLILCCPLLLLPSIFPSIRVFLLMNCYACVQVLHS